MRIQIEIKLWSEISKKRASEVNDWINKIFVPFEPPDAEWALPKWQLILSRNTDLVTALGVYERTILVGQRTTLVGGIGSVFTVPKYRRRGFVKISMISAVDFLCREVGVDFALLLCEPRLISFYRALNWTEVNAPVTIQDSRGSRELLEYRPMVYRCVESIWPPGGIDMLGLPW